MKVGDLVQYVDPSMGRTAMPLVLLGLIIDMKVKTSMISDNKAELHARVQWGNHGQQTHWLPIDYLEVVR